MYIPPHFKQTDRAAMIAFMQRYSFATLVTAADDCPTATHLPFIVLDDGEHLVLRAHFAKANPQSRQIAAAQTCLVLFSEPHAYISPQLYESPINVPTWNYIAVHAYGKAQLIADEIAATALLEQTINYYEAQYMVQWNSLPQDYKDRLLKGIVAFEIVVTELQGKQKLSQNKSDTDRQRIADSLAQSPHSYEQDLANYMQNSINNNR